MTYRLLSLVVIFTQSIQLSKIVERIDNPLLSCRIAYPASAGLEHSCSRFNFRPGRQKFNLKQTSLVSNHTFEEEMVELTGIEPMTSCLQSRRSPN
jgi:hypothetical protein